MSHYANKAYNSASACLSSLTSNHLITSITACFCVNNESGAITHLGEEKVGRTKNRLHGNLNASHLQNKCVRTSPAKHECRGGSCLLRQGRAHSVLSTTSNCWTRSCIATSDWPSRAVHLHLLLLTSTSLDSFVNYLPLCAPWKAKHLLQPCAPSRRKQDRVIFCTAVSATLTANHIQSK